MPGARLLAERTASALATLPLECGLKCVSCLLFRSSGDHAAALLRRGETMPSYLLTCACGTILPVEVGQAGGQVECACGAKLDVPPLSQLRHLPVASPVAAGLARHWSASQGAVAACLVLAGLLTVAAAWSRLSEPSIPKFDAVARNRFMEEQVEKLTPASGWWVWVDAYRRLGETGFREMDVGPSLALQQHIARGRFIQTTMLVLCAVCIAAVVVVVLWRKTLRSPSRR